jgi:hypothetical protein
VKICDSDWHFLSIWHEEHIIQQLKAWSFRRWKNLVHTQYKFRYNSALKFDYLYFDTPCIKSTFTLEIIYSIITTYQIWLTGVSISTNGNFASCGQRGFHLLMCCLQSLLSFRMPGNLNPRKGGTARSLLQIDVYKEKKGKFYRDICR